MSPIAGMVGSQSIRHNQRLRSPSARSADRNGNAPSKVGGGTIRSADAAGEAGRPIKRRSSRNRRRYSCW